MKYYSERKNVLDEDYEIDLRNLKEYFLDVFYYFERQGDFKSAFIGIYSGERQLKAPAMGPSPEIYFLKHLRNSNIYPIEVYYNKYSQEELFTVIEILHNHIARYDIESQEYDFKQVQEEFREYINSILRFYDKGYFLNINGHILELPNDGLLELLKSKNEVIESELTKNKLETAMKMYLHHTSNREEKRKAINLLADIIEPFRYELQDILNEEWEINKNKHDNLIFEIVNKFNIRHNKTVMNYSEEIWFDWMFHYYISVIKTYYRLKEARELQNFFSD